MNDDTIAALASAPGPSLRGIIRVSGPRVKAAVGELFQPDNPARWQDACLPASHPGVVPVGSRRMPLDVSVLLWPGERSYTGQPMVELHTTGSPPLLESVLADLYRRGVRPAEPGEFTLRAFLAGRIDLAQAEAVLGVIDAEDRRGLTAALRQLAGGLSEPVTQLRDDLLELLGDLEAGLDFVEEDIEFVGRDDVTARLIAARAAVIDLLEKAAGRTRSTGRRRIVFAGLPNAGKSTLFNAFSGRNAAIVSHRQGTTRDFLTAEVDWGGLAVELVDTAGWETAGSGISHAAQEARSGVWKSADLIVWCRAADATATDRAADDQLFAQAAGLGPPVMRITTKADLASPADLPLESGVSVPDQSGFSELRDTATELLASAGGDDDRFLGATSARVRGSLQGASESLTAAIDAAEFALGDELVAAEIRETLQHLGALVGAVYTDDLLDRIFSKFCIGK